MGLRLHLENLRSQTLWSAVLTSTASAGLLGLCLGTASCVIIQDDGPEDDGYYDYVPPPDEQPSDDPVEVVIDTGATLSVEPGEGVGVFVEHLGDGFWHVSTTCDTSYSGYACAFNLNLQALNLRVSDLEDLESDDAVSEGVDLVYFDPTTAFDSDAMVLEAEPDAPLRLEVFLDGRSEPRFTYWIGGGILHTGAPSNPLDFRPEDPDVEPPPEES